MLLEEFLVALGGTRQPATHGLEDGLLGGRIGDRVDVPAVDTGELLAHRGRDHRPLGLVAQERQHQGGGIDVDARGERAGAHARSADRIGPADLDLVIVVEAGDVDAAIHGRELRP
jgi:hypothetical protein